MEQVKQFAAMIVAKVKQQSPAPAGTFQDEERGSSGKKGRAATSGKGARSPGTGRTAKTKRGSTASPGRGGEASASLAASPPAYSGGVSKPAGSPPASTGAVSKSAGSPPVSTGAASKSAGSPQASTGAASRPRPAAQPPQTGSGGLQALGRCPSGCGGSIIEGKRGYGCSRFREGCRFVIWKEQHGRKLTPAMLQSLLGKGITSLAAFPQPGGTAKGRLVLTNRSLGEVELQLISATE